MNLDIRSLTLGKNQLGDDCIDGLIGFIKYSNRLRVLDLEQNDITDAGFEKLGKAILSSRKLEELNIGSNKKITKKSLSLITNLLAHKPLKIINYTGTSIPGNHFSAGDLPKQIKSGKLSLLSLKEK